jgi:hypothetical protein
MAFHANHGVHLDENGRVSLWENQAMAFRIKPEDVPAELRDLANDYVQGAVVREWEIARILNAAIEAGLVSPPCHVHRYLGELECQGGTLDPALFIGKPKEKGDEHWKGQTE